VQLVQKCERQNTKDSLQEWVIEANPAQEREK